MDKYFNGDRIFYRLVIDCYKTAGKKTANYWYAVNMCRKKSSDNLISIDATIYHQRFNNAYKELFF